MAKGAAIVRQPYVLPVDDPARAAKAKDEQSYDPNPPRCSTCVYFTRGGNKVRIEAAKGRGVDHLKRCTFGNFRTHELAVCDEWHSRAGERIENPEVAA